jgi:hypothetical protein
LCGGGEGSFSGFLNFLGYSVVLGLVGRHPIEKIGERWCGRVSSVTNMLKNVF